MGANVNSVGTAIMIFGAAMISIFLITLGIRKLIDFLDPEISGKPENDHWMI